MQENGKRLESDHPSIPYKDAGDPGAAGKALARPNGRIQGYLKRVREDLALGLSHPQ